MNAADKAELERMRKWSEQTVSAAHMHRRVELERADAWQEAMQCRRMLGTKTKADEAEAKRRWDELGPEWQELARSDAHLAAVLRYHVLAGHPLWVAVQFFRLSAVAEASLLPPRDRKVPDFVADPRPAALLEQARAYHAIRQKGAQRRADAGVKR